jgi:ribonuclease P protein component
MAENDPVFKCVPFIARAKIAKYASDPRYGLVATKRSFRHAVDRNRAKRLLRVWIRANQKLMSPDHDYVFIARPPILSTGLAEGSGLMKRALKKLKF